MPTRDDRYGTPARHTPSIETLFEYWHNNHRFTIAFEHSFCSIINSKYADILGEYLEDSTKRHARTADTSADMKASAQAKVQEPRKHDPRNTHRTSPHNRKPCITRRISPLLVFELLAGGGVNRI
ncbi:hypothetical protein Pth03_81160 [Planotetraspora thailandica]|uniref:Uncharacterized protein n=1 Tax=Planotetraspora thailandica TaxID=487172 RepID=A0A8J3Y2X1_9ACTN|nr:hypothetical protein Pth03_81160 [Planotetraspora thailandica]